MLIGQTVRNLQLITVGFNITCNLHVPELEKSAIPIVPDK